MAAPGKCLLVTGSPGVWKTTLITRFFEALKASNPNLKVKEDTDLYIIDEVGKIELYNSSFLSAVLKVLESSIPVLASVPIPKLGRDVPGVSRVKNHPGAKIYTLTASNRDAFRDQIYSELNDLFPRRSA